MCTMGAWLELTRATYSLDTLELIIKLERESKENEQVRRESKSSKPPRAKTWKGKSRGRRSWTTREGRLSQYVVVVPMRSNRPLRDEFLLAGSADSLLNSSEVSGVIDVRDERSPCS